MAKPTLIVSGNCQSRFVSRVLAANPEIEDRYRVIYYRAFRKGDTDEDLALDDLQNCEVLLEQIAHQAPEFPGKQHLPAGCRQITFPILFHNTLWPQTIDDHRNEPTKSKAHPAGLWPYGDRYLLKLLDQGKSPDKIVDQYLEWDFAEKLDLERFHQITWSKIKELDKRADIKLGVYVHKRFRKKRLFVTRNHPSLEMLTVMRDKVFEALELAPAVHDDDIEPASGGMYNVHVPIHPSIARFFEIEWYSPDMLFRTHGEDMPIREYLQRYVDFK